MFIIVPEANFEALGIVVFSALFLKPLRHAIKKRIIIHAKTNNAVDLSVARCQQFIKSFCLSNCAREAIKNKAACVRVHVELLFDLIVCSFALHLAEPSRLPGLTWALSRIADEMVIISPHKRPPVEAGFELMDGFAHKRVRVRRFLSTR